jgi:hypothetical protein
MRFGNERTPTYPEVLEAAVTQGLLDTHTMLPGKIEKYDPVKQKADVKPLIKRTVILQDSTELTAESLPVIPDVPVIFPQGSGFFLSVPLQKGDYVMLLFCERSIDQYISGQGIDTDPIDTRIHDLSDAVALPGFVPYARSLKNVVSDEMRLGQDDEGIQIRLKTDGEIDITYANGQTLHIENKDGDAVLTLGDGAVHAMIAERFSTFWGTVKSTFDGHSHANHGVPPATPLPGYDSNVTSSKVSFPDG